MTRRSIDVIIAALVCLVAVGAYVVWYGVVSKKAAEAAQYTRELGAQGEAGSRAANARKALEDLGPQETDVYGHLVAEDDIVPFLEGLEATGERLGSNVDVVSVTNTESDSLSLSVRITGSFDAVMRTLGAIEYQSYETALTNLTLDTPGSRTWTAAATFVVGMRQNQP